MEAFNEIVDGSDRAFDDTCEGEWRQSTFVVFVRILVVNGHCVNVVPAHVSDKQRTGIDQCNLLAQHCLIFERHTLR